VLVADALDAVAAKTVLEDGRALQGLADRELRPGKFFLDVGARPCERSG
jgi:hypothetical protein